MTFLRLARALGLALMVSCGTAAFITAQAPSLETRLAQAKDQFDRSGDLVQIAAALDSLISDLGPLAPKDAVAARLLPSAYALRARVRWQLAKADEAGADLKALLKVDPSFKFPDEVPKRLVRALEDIRKTSVGMIVLNLAPVDAVLELDGAPFTQAAGPILLAVGPHTLSGRRPGCRSASQTFSVSAGATTDVVLTLERIAATVALVTSPPGVEVLVDGVSRGRTEPGPLTPRWDEPLAKAGLQPGAVSQPFVLGELALGPHTLGFTRECHVGIDLRVEITKLTDQFLEPVKIEPAVATISVESQPPGATVWLDGDSKGTAPLQIENICEGDHIVDVRSTWGRYVRRLPLRAGENVKIQGVVKPTVAVLPVNGLPKGHLGADLRVELERRFGTATTLSLFAPPIEKVEQALAAEKLSSGWLAFNTWGRPMGEAAKAVTSPARLQIGGRISRSLDVQGVAELTARPNADLTQFFLSILAADSSEPDVLELTTDSPDSINKLIMRLDRVPPMYRPSAGVTVADVLDVPGVVVVTVDAAGKGAGLAPGDVITKLDGQPTKSGADFAAALAQRKKGETVTAEVQGRNGAARPATLTINMARCLVAMNDQSLLFNNLVLVLKTRIATSGNAVDPVERLNLAVALMRLRNYAEARTQLTQVKLDPGPGVSGGTVHYLLGLCHEQLGPLADAEKEWRLAEQDSESLLTEDGPFIQELAREKLDKLKK